MMLLVISNVIMLGFVLCFSFVHCCNISDKAGSGCVLGRMLSTVSVRRALFIGCMLQLFQQIVGINTVMYGISRDSPTVSAAIRDLSASSIQLI